MRLRRRESRAPHRVGQSSDDVAIRGGESTHDRPERRGTLSPLLVRQAAEPGARRPERMRASVLCEVALSLLDQRERERLRLVGGVSAHEMTPWPPRTTPTSSGCAVDEVAQAQAEIEARPLPVEPAEPAAEGIGNAFRPVGGGREGDQRVGVEMVDVREPAEIRARACRSRAPRRPARSGRDRAGRPCRPPGRGPRRRAPSRAAARGRPGRGPRRSGCRDRRPNPSPRARCGSRPVIGSASSTLAEVLPPPKLVTRGSEPRRRDRSTSATISGCSSGLLAIRDRCAEGVGACGRVEPRVLEDDRDVARGGVGKRDVARQFDARKLAGSVSRMWRVRREPTVTSTGPTGSRSSK